MRRATWAPFLVIAIAAGAISCKRQAAMQPPKVPTSEPTRQDREDRGAEHGKQEAQELDALEQRLASSEAELAGLLPIRAEMEAPSEEKVPATADQPAGGASAAPAPPTGRSSHKATRTKDGLPCQRACGALASMRRCADGICRLAGDEPARCKRARERVDEAGARIEAARCVCEGDDGG